MLPFDPSSKDATAPLSVNSLSASSGVTASSGDRTSPLSALRVTAA